VIPHREMDGNATSRRRMKYNFRHHKANDVSSPGHLDVRRILGTPHAGRRPIFLERVGVVSARLKAGLSNQKFYPACEAKRAAKEAWFSTPQSGPARTAWALLGNWNRLGNR